MVNNRCASLGSLRSSISDVTSQTTSAEESNVLTASLTEERDTLKGLKFDPDHIDEVQSPERGLLESLLADHLGFGPDFMISSPRRDYMVCSPRRDFMLISSPKREFPVTSPRRDYMLSSPKRECMFLSPRRSNGVGSINNLPPALIHPSYSSLSHHGNGKSQSPLNKVCNSSSASLYATYSSAPAEYLHPETLALPAVEAFFEDYGREGYDVHSPALKYTGVGNEFSAETFAPPAPAAMPSLLDCFVMESRYGGSEGEMMAAGIQLSEDDDELYRHFGGGAAAQAQYQEPAPQQKTEIGHGFLSSVASNSSANITTSRNSDMVNAPYHELTGDTSSIISSGQEQEQESGLQLVHLLLACAEAIAKNDIVAARRYHHLLNRVVSPFGDSMQRVGSCFADALDARIAASPCSSSSPRPRAPFPPPALEVLKIYQIIYQACPYIKFAHFTANQAIFEAFESEDCVHVIDLDILQGYQWPAFLQALAARPGGAPALRITGVGYPADAVRETGRHLAELAHSLRVPFEFHAAAVDHLEDLRPSMLHRRVGEALAVNSVNRLHRVPGAHLGPLLAMIRDQAPKIFTLVEQEASHNGPYFLGRFLEALHYYSAIFDSLDATFPADSAARAKVEQLLLAPEIGNIVACEGSERVARHERLERWRRVMEGRVFKGVPLSANAVNQSKILLGLYPCDGYRLTEDNGCLLLGWQDRPIIAASAWRC